ncbi:MAG: DUF2304 domain-containing protein [Saprospiraceae bacterium]
MKLELYQWLVPILAGFYIIRTIKQYTSGKYSPRNTIIWITFWIAIGLLGIMPNEIAASLAKGLGFRDRPNAIIFVALGALFLMVFYLSAALNRVENQLTNLVRQLALSQVLLPEANEETPNTKTTQKNKISNKPKNNTIPLIENIEELENIVNKLIDTNSELPENIPNEGKTPKSKSKK